MRLALHFKSMIFDFIKHFIPLFSHVATHLSSKGWVDFVPDLTHLEKNSKVKVQKTKPMTLVNYEVKIYGLQGLITRKGAQTDHLDSGWQCNGIIWLA